MSEPAHTQSHKQQKFDYYARQDIVGEYETSRFGRPSGQWIREVEEQAILSLLNQAAVPDSATLLDLATGTGRNIPQLKRFSDRIIACDLSLPMLGQASARDADCLACDASKIALETESIDGVLASRFFFHFDDLSPYLREVYRLLKPGGFVIFDVCNWTPRTWIPGSQNWLGGRMYLHRRARVQSLADATGFALESELGSFALPPFLYQHLPMPVVKILECAFTALLFGYRNKVYYLLRKTDRKL